MHKQGENMSKRLVLVLGLVVAIAAGLGGAAYAGSGALTGPVTISTVEMGGNQEFLILNKNANDATGNEFAVSGPLYRLGAHTRVGKLRGVCFIVTKKFGIGQCAFTASLHQGNVTVSGTINFAQGATDTLAVTGGTGKFRNARGEGVARNTGQTSESLVFHLIP